MSRTQLTFSCEGAQLAASLDSGSGTTGLLIVSGGNEVRSGPWGSQAAIAATLSAKGIPVFRFDRRGVGDSSGPNLGFRESAADIAAALAAFRAEAPQLTRIVGWGNCDAASALMLAGGEGFDALVLSNPWTIEGDDIAAPPAALRAHYAQRLKNPAALLRLVSGKVAPRQLFASLRDALRPAPPPPPLAAAMAEGLARFTGDAAILIAGRDRTAQAFLGVWDRRDPRIRICEGASHSFVELEARGWLLEQLVAALAGRGDAAD